MLQNQVVILVFLSFLLLGFQAQAFTIINHSDQAAKVIVEGMPTIVSAGEISEFLPTSRQDTYHIKVDAIKNGVPIKCEMGSVGRDAMVTIPDGCQHKSEF